MLELARKVLIITSSGGGGLLQAAIAKEQEVKSKNPTAKLTRRDMMRDWYWKSVGRYGVRQWDKAQREGNVKKLEWLLAWQSTGDIIFWPWVFYRALRTFFKEEIDHVIDTQPLGTSAVLLALRIYNRRRKKSVILEKVAVDLPTRLNTHYFAPIRKLSKRNRELLKLITIPPLTDSLQQTTEEFWRKHCRLSSESVIYEYYPVRQSFRKVQGRQRDGKEFCFEAKLANSDEGLLLAKAVEGKDLSLEIDGLTARFKIAPKARVIILLLGSQPAFSATLGYVRQIQMLMKKIDGPSSLFVLCAEHFPKEDSLLKQVSDIAQTCSNKDLSVVPLSFQLDAVIASLFYRSDLTCTRSGGQTMMELMCTTRGEYWIHSESKKEHGRTHDLTLDELLKGIPGWEAGNALYLKRYFDAKVVTPLTCHAEGEELIRRWTRESR